MLLARALVAARTAQSGRPVLLRAGLGGGVAALAGRTARRPVPADLGGITTRPVADADEPAAATGGARPRTSDAAGGTAKAVRTSVARTATRGATDPVGVATAPVEANEAAATTGGGRPRTSDAAGGTAKAVRTSVAACTRWVAGGRCRGTAGSGAARRSRAAHTCRCRRERRRRPTPTTTRLACRTARQGGPAATRCRTGRTSAEAAAGIDTGDAALATARPAGSHALGTTAR